MRAPLDASPATGVASRVSSAIASAPGAWIFRFDRTSASNALATPRRSATDSARAAASTSVRSTAETSSVDAYGNRPIVSSMADRTSGSVSTFIRDVSAATALWNARWSAVDRDVFHPAAA